MTSAVRILLTVLVVAACESKRAAPAGRARRATPASAGTAAAAPPHAPALVGKTGPAELLPADGAPLHPVPLAQYAEHASHRPGAVVVTRFPAGLSPLAGAGVGLRVGDKDVSWVIDGEPSRGFVFWYDANANGDLRDDAKHTLVARPGDDAWEAAFTLQVEGMFSGELVAAPARIRLRVKQGELRLQTSIARRGSLSLPGGPLAFALIGDSGQFGLDHHYLAFDLDRDGALAVDRLDDPELFHVFEKHVTLDDTSYAFSLDLAGDTLTLTPLRERLPARASLATGTPAPDIQVTDLDGAPASLAAQRGKVVLVDFWATSCAPCVKALPRIAALRSQHGPAGLEVMSIAMETPDVREVLGPHRTGIAAMSDAAQLRYRVDRYPMYFLIARDGTIACSRCQLDKVEAMLAAELAKPAP